MEGPLGPLNTIYGQYKSQYHFFSNSEKLSSLKGVAPLEPLIQLFPTQVHVCLVQCARHNSSYLHKTWPPYLWEKHIQTLYLVLNGYKYVGYCIITHVLMFAIYRYDMLGFVYIWQNWTGNSDRPIWIYEYLAILHNTTYW